MVCAAVPAGADDTQWRLITSDDGLPESWVYHVARGSGGRVWTSHGIAELGSYDGYTTSPQSTRFGEVDLSVGPDDVLWTLTRINDRCTGVQRLRGAAWETFAVDQIGEVPFWHVRLLAWAVDRALLQTPDHLFEIDAGAGSVTVVRSAADAGIGHFTDLQRARDGGVWIGAERGMAHLARSMAWTVAPLPPGTGAVERITDSRRGLLVVARPAADGTVLLRRTGDGWVRISAGTADAPIRAAWEAVDDTTWIARSTNRDFDLSYIRPGQPEVKLPRTRALSGILYDIAPAEDGGFWLATSIGLVRNLPATWRRPPAPAHRDLHTGSLMQSRAGDLYAVRDDALLRRAGDEWQAHPMPPGTMSNVQYTDVLGELADGRIVIGAADQGSLVSFDPSTSRLERLVHPERRQVEMLGRTRAGEGIWTITRNPGDRARLERYDGGRFTPRVELDGDWDGARRPRVILETSQGDLVVTPTPHGIGRLRGAEWTYYPGLTSLPETQPFAVTELPDGRLWFGGREGISELHDGRLRLLRGGLQTVRSIIAASDGSVWAASNSGVHRFHDSSWMTMNNEDGLPDAAAIDVFEEASGRIWVSTTAGFTARHADADRHPPQTLLSPGANPTEAPPSGEMRLVFDGIDRWRHTGTARLVYSHRVDDGPWSPYTTATGVTLSRMRSGEHTFAVRAMDRNGQVDATPAEWRFAVLLPWFREPMVMALTALGAIAAAIAVISFFTRQKRLAALVAARTQQLRNELGERQRVEQERAELEQQLQQSQRMEALGRLAGGISHDFNNLLTVICSYGDLLAEEIATDDPRHPHAEEIVKAANRAAVLTQQLLSFSRHQAVARQVLDLNTTVADLLRMLVRLLGEDVDVRFSPGEQLWPIRAHRGQLEQIVVNLSVNARDAMPEGGRLTIETANVDLAPDYVRTHVDARPGPHVRLSVADTGIGMDPDTSSRIFEPFFTTKERGKGSGLGLAMVYGIVHQHDGHIVVHSTPKQGTRFDIFLPRTFDEPSVLSESARQVRANGRETILLVEDEDAVRQLAAEVLGRYGYRVVAAGSGEEALGIVDLQKLRPDLLLTDVVMPGISGNELAERLRQKWRALPIVLMSGYSADAVLQNGDRIGFLQKPFTATTLGQKVGEMLRD